MRQDRADRFGLVCDGYAEFINYRNNWRYLYRGNVGRLLYVLVQSYIAPINIVGITDLLQC